ncbi:Ig-like domain-containing protein [Gemmatimonas sp.]|uniref:Ig-like domain-containing protein n=1 Tax=Gemmatimonas sp. TaxID=1962908 RepID=UPI003DA2DDDA
MQFFGASGAPLAGAAVTWSATGGKRALQTSTTDANGMARTTIKADTKAGTSYVKATAGDPAALEAMAMRAGPRGVPRWRNVADVFAGRAWRSAVTSGNCTTAVRVGTATAVAGPPLRFWTAPAVEEHCGTGAFLVVDSTTTAVAVPSHQSVAPPAKPVGRLSTGTPTAVLPNRRGRPEPQ